MINDPEITGLPDFTLQDKGAVSRAFIQQGCNSFHTAAHFIKHLAYGRNANKNDLLTVFSDKCGTCSTKHALLKLLADEHGYTDVRLVMGLLKMSGATSPEVTNTLQQYQLEFIPEAHNYLTFNGRRFDLMKSTASAAAFEPVLIEETEIRPDQITDFKVNYHKTYLKKWLAENPQIALSFDELWIAREQCIKDLGNQ